MTHYAAHLSEEPLIKAFKFKAKAPKPKQLGTWKGLPILCYGKRGGKIVGYDAKGKPIYASSSAAEALAAQAAATSPDKGKQVGSWLLSLGLASHVIEGKVLVQPAAATLLEEHFGVKAVSWQGKVAALALDDLVPHVGKPLTPKDDDLIFWTAAMAAGEAEKSSFPDLTTLKEIPAGKWAGSHGNRLFVDPAGRRWVFKSGNPTISFAEEAASRIGRLILGSAVAPAKVVEIEGKVGALVGEVPGEEIGPEHKGPSEAVLIDHAEQIASHFVLDWLVSNHDTHAGNLLVSNAGIAAIDKGQAWRFFGDDELSTTYAPNPSPPAYIRLWKLVKEGKVPFEAILSGVAKALDKAETITPEQFHQIVAPYVSAAAGFVGFDPDTRIAQMTKRLTNLRKDFGQFLAGLTGADEPIKIPSGKHAENFETMPEDEPSKPAVTDPAAPKVLEEKPPAPVVPEKAVPGWPITKGKVTVHHPGEPPPAGTWPSGYPGPGFTVSLTYKKQSFKVKFLGNPDGTLKVEMTYPGGSVKYWDSPNQASDSLYLFAKGLPLDMSATEKKAKGISYPAKTAFGIKAFKEDLALAHAGEVPLEAKSVDELEAEGLVAPEQEQLSAWDLIEKEPDGPFFKTDLLPTVVKEALKAYAVAFGIDYAPMLPPGLVYKAQWHGKSAFVLAQIVPSGDVTYHVFQQFGTSTIKVASIASGNGDLIWDLKSEPILSGMKKHAAEVAAKTAEEAIGASPKAEPVPESAPTKQQKQKKPKQKPAEIKIPPDAPSEFKGPLPPGTIVKVEKDFPWGSGVVQLTVNTGGGFFATYRDGDKVLQGEEFSSLSAAANWIWFAQNGYADLADFQAKTGKKKPTGVAGWGFWGVQAKTPAPPKPVLPDMPGMVEVSFPSYDTLFGYPPGTQLVWLSQAGKIFKATKTDGQKWLFVGDTDKEITTYDFDAAQFYASAQKTLVKVPEGAEPIKPAPVEVGQTTVLKEVPPTEDLDNYPVGAKFKFFASDDSVYYVTKQPSGKWLLDGASSEVGSDKVQKWLGIEIDDLGSSYLILPEGAPESKVELLTVPSTSQFGEWKGLGAFQADLNLTAPEYLTQHITTGDTYLFTNDAGVEDQITKLENGQFQLHSTGQQVSPEAASKLLQASQTGFKATKFWQLKTPPPDLEVGNWDTMPEAPSADELEAMPVGTKIKYWDPTYDTWTVAEKLAFDQKGVSYWGHIHPVLGGDINLADTESFAGDLEQTAEAHPPKKAQEGGPAESPVPPEIVVSNFANMPQGEIAAVLQTLPVGSVIVVKIDGEDAENYVKKSDDEKGWHFFTTGPGSMISRQKTAQFLAASAEVGKDEKKTVEFVLNPKAAPPVAPVPTAPKPITLTMVPDVADLAEMPAGYEIHATKPSGETVTFAKNEDGEWIASKGPDYPSESLNIQLNKLADEEDATLELLKLTPQPIIAEPSPIVAAVGGNVPIAKPPTLKEINELPIGTILSVIYPDGATLSYTKAENEDWKSSAGVIFYPWVFRQKLLDAVEAENATLTLKTPTTEPPPVATVKVKTTVKGAIASEAVDNYPGLVKIKPSKKPGHTNILISDKGKGKAALEEFLAKYGLTSVNKNGEPQFTYGSWWITVPNAQLEKGVEVELPADATLPLEAETTATKKAKKVKAPKLPKAPEKTPEQLAAEQKAKEVVGWLNTVGPLSDAQALHILAWARQEVFGIYQPGMPMWARDGGPGKVLLGSPSAEFQTVIQDLIKGAKQDGLPFDIEKVSTPLGDFWRIDVAQLAALTPGQPAGTMTGPDGKLYPAKTKFKKKVATYTAKDLLAADPDLTKIVDHKTDPSLKVLKIAGTDEANKQKLLDLAKKYGLKSAGEPIQGGHYWLMSVQEGDLQQTAKEDVTYEAKSPKQPPPFISAAYPTSVGGGAVGQLGSSSPGDLAAIGSIDTGKFGHAIRMGAADVFVDQQVYVRKVKGADGKMYHEVFGELQSFDPASSLLTPGNIDLPSAMTAKNPHSIGFKLHSFQDGVHDESGPHQSTITTQSGYRATFSDGRSIGVCADFQALKNCFRVRVPADQDLPSVLHEAFAAMGVDPAKAMRQQTEDDERITKKLQILRAMIGPDAWMKPSPKLPPEKIGDEAWLDSQLKKYGVTQAMVDSARFETTFGSHQSVVFDDGLATDPNAAFVYMGNSLDGVFYQILDGLGWGSRTARYQNGIEQGGASVDEDLLKGGANGAFARIGHRSSGGSWGYKCSGWKVVFHPRLLSRADWRFYAGDSFGQTVSYSGNARPRSKVLSQGPLEQDNEILFDSGISLHDVAGIMAPDNSEKESLIKRLKAAGISDVNGIALEDLIQVPSGGSREEAATLFVGLKEGVLP